MIMTLPLAWIGHYLSADVWRNFICFDNHATASSSDGGNEKNFPLPPDWAAPRQSLPPSPSFQVGLICRWHCVVDNVVIIRLTPTGREDYPENVIAQIARTITKMKANRRHRTPHQATTWNHRLVSASRLSASRLERGLATRSLSCCNVLVVIMVIKITRIVVATLPEPLWQSRSGWPQVLPQSRAGQSHLRTKMRSNGFRSR